MIEPIDRMKRRLVAALVTGTEDQFDTLKQIFLEEFGEVRIEVEAAMELIIAELNELLD